jgi:hypothetical protein
MRTSINANQDIIVEDMTAVIEIKNSCMIRKLVISAIS